MDVSENILAALPEIGDVEDELETLLVSLQGVSLTDTPFDTPIPVDLENTNNVNTTANNTTLPVIIPTHTDNTTATHQHIATAHKVGTTVGASARRASTRKAEHNLTKYKLQGRKAVDHGVPSAPTAAAKRTAAVPPPPPRPTTLDAVQVTDSTNSTAPAPTVEDLLSVESILLKASLVGRDDVVEACISEDVDLSHRDASGWTAMHHAAAGGALGSLKIIVTELQRTNQVELINERCVKGWTPIHLSVCRDFLEVTKYLINAGAQMFIPLTHNSPPCRAKLAASEIIHFAAIRGNIPILCILLHHGSVVNCLDDHDRTPLHYAAYRPRPEVVSFLLECGASVNCVDTQGRTPLHSAALGGNMENCTLLLSAGAAPEVKDIWDLAPSKVAASIAVAEVVKGGSSVAPSDITGWWSTSLSTCAVYDELSNFERTVASAIISGLQEKKEAQVGRAVKRLGVERCVCAFDNAMQLQNSGGLKRKDGKGNRAAGGVFFNFLLEELKQEAAAAGLPWKRMTDWGYITMEDDEKKKGYVLHQRKARREQLLTRALDDDTKAPASQVRSDHHTHPHPYSGGSGDAYRGGGGYKKNYNYCPR